MFGIGMPELILILVVALIIIGPKKLPDMAKTLGRAINEFKRATQDITDSIDITGSVRPVDKNPAGRISHDGTAQNTKPAVTESGSLKPEQDEQTPEETPTTPETTETPGDKDENVKSGQEAKTETPGAGGLDG
ncbi:MAG: twin-arginine translocase TatA/TatE family subunit [Deltaproteobacteria bacterium]|nr:twin-arginine translocase TatA/TatE family subunit [Deltaproteobacteria bacterium]